jgi:hypothetical protein
MRLIVTRTVTTDECDWLEQDIQKGQIVFVFTGCTYGAINSGIAVSLTGAHDNPFFELPQDALEVISLVDGAA